MARPVKKMSTADTAAVASDVSLANLYLASALNRLTSTVGSTKAISKRTRRLAKKLEALNKEMNSINVKSITETPFTGQPATPVTATQVRAEHAKVNPAPKSAGFFEEI